MSPRRFILLTLCAAAVPAVTLPLTAAAPPPLPILIAPTAAQQRLQAQLAVQQARAQASVAAAQAKVQAQLDANQARLEERLAAQQAGTQAPPAAAGQGATTAAELASLSLPLGGAMQESAARRTGTMQLTTLTPRLGSYFGTDHGVLVVRAPTHGVLQLEDGDVILAIGGRVPASSSQAIRILTSYDPGEKIRLVILRAHRRIEVTATMPAWPVGP